MEICVTGIGVHEFRWETLVSLSWDV